MIRIFRTFRSLEPGQRQRLLEAAVLLGLARLAVVFLPFRMIATQLGHPTQESPPTDNDADVTLLRQISWAIHTVSRRAPWRCKCLEQAIAGKMMLRRRKYSSTLYLGIARQEKQLEAHAWVRSGDFLVTGGGDLTRYAVVSTFADQVTR